MQRRHQLKRMEVQEKNRAPAPGTRSSWPTSATSSPASPAAWRGSRRRSPAAARHPDSRPPTGCCARSRGSAGQHHALLAHLGARAFDRRAIASLAGLAPRAHESRRYRGRRFLGDGRRRSAACSTWPPPVSCSNPVPSGPHWTGSWATSGSHREGRRPQGPPSLTPSPPAALPIRLSVPHRHGFDPGPARPPRREGRPGFVLVAAGRLRAGAVLRGVGANWARRGPTGQSDQFFTHTNCA